MINPLQIKDLDIKNFLRVILAVQLAIWGVIGIDAIGIQIPILRQLIGFIYLTFVPGIIILRIIKLHKLSNIETLLYTVGLSITTLMFTGLFMNTVYPLFGISGPISITPLIITISIIVLALCVLSYVRDKDFSDPSFIDIKDILSPLALFLCLIPFLAVFGTYLVNFYHTNILLMLLICIIALITILISFDRLIPKKLYPFAVIIIALTLLYHRSLISMYLTGCDIQSEYHLSNLVIIHSLWDPTISSTCNAMLSIVMLAPIYSNILDMNLTWVFKVIYPVFYSLVPLGLYQVFQKQTNDKIAFLSCCFFMFISVFFAEMISLARQQIAELFFVLLILLMIDKDINKIKRAFLSIIFGISLVVSHYGLSYIYMFSLISVWLILILSYSKFSRDGNREFTSTPPSLEIENRTISSTFVLLFITFTLTWYMYVSSSSAFDTIVHIGDHIASTIFTEFLNPEAAQGLNIILRETVTPLHSVSKYLHLLSQFFIFVGGITLMLNRKGMKFEREYEAFSIVNLVICFAAIGVPYFASALNMTRLYHITLIFLAPFCVIGGVTVFKMLSKAVKVSWTNKSVRSSLRVLSVFFAIFLLFNSGFVYEVAKDHPMSISLSMKSIKESGSLLSKQSFYCDYIPEQDVFSSKWIWKNYDKKSKIYSDLAAYWTVLRGYCTVYYYIGRLDTLSPTAINLYKSSYQYLTYVNNIEGLMLASSSYPVTYNTTEISYLIKDKNKIYTNGGSEIYYYE